MAGIDVGGGHGGGRAVNQEVPLVPFIDFLLCCVMFLLVTAVWNQVARVEATVAAATIGPAAVEEPPEVRRLRIGPDGYELRMGIGGRESIARSGERYDVARLTRRLGELRSQERNRADLVVEAEDGVKYADVIDAMDATTAAGWEEVAVAPEMGGE